MLSACSRGRKPRGGVGGRAPGSGPDAHQGPDTLPQVAQEQLLAAAHANDAMKAALHEKSLRESNAEWDCSRPPAPNAILSATSARIDVLAMRERPGERRTVKVKLSFHK